MSGESLRENVYKTALKDLQDLPSWGRILLAFLVLFVIVKWTPIFDLLYLAFMIVLVPTAFLICLALFSMDTFNMFLSTVNMIAESIKKSIKENNQDAPADQQVDQEEQA